MFFNLRIGKNLMFDSFTLIFILQFYSNVCMYDISKKKKMGGVKDRKLRFSIPVVRLNNLSTRETVVIFFIF